MCKMKVQSNNHISQSQPFSNPNKTFHFFFFIFDHKGILANRSQLHEEVGRFPRQQFATLWLKKKNMLKPLEKREKENLFEWFSWFVNVEIALLELLHPPPPLWSMSQSFPMARWWLQVEQKKGENGLEISNLSYFIHCF